MNISKKVLFLLATILLAASFTPAVQADFVLEQAKNVVNAFNSLNDGQGYYYKVSPDNGRWSMNTMQGYDQADFGAYSPLVGGENFAKTFCVEPLVGTGARHYGTLNYENGATTTQSGNSLTLGAAYLYASFATGALDGYNYDKINYNEGYDLTKAIQSLIGAIYGENWLANDFLTALLGVNDDKSYWEQVYDPGKYYDEIGDYSVFVMNNRDEYGTHAQDFLYLAAHDGNPGPATPEPASMLIFGAGLAGLALAKRCRKKRV